MLFVAIDHLFETSRPAILNDFAKGFDKMIERPRKSAKVVLFPDRKEYEAAVKLMGER